MCKMVFITFYNMVWRTAAQGAHYITAAHSSNIIITMFVSVTNQINVKSIAKKRFHDKIFVSKCSIADFTFCSQNS